jgi:hypothetical protein
MADGRWSAVVAAGGEVRLPHPREIDYFAMLVIAKI